MQKKSALGMSELKQDIIDNFIAVIQSNSRISNFFDIEELRLRLEENLLTVSRHNLASYGFPKNVQAGVWGRNMLLQKNQAVQSEIVFHETLHMASSNFIENEGGTTTWKSGLEESMAPSEFFDISIRNGNDIYQANDFNDEIQNGNNKAINEGITQYITRILTGKTEQLPHFNPLQRYGLSLVKDNMYPMEQTIVEEIIAFYDEEGIIKSYFENSPELLMRAIDKNGTVPNVSSKFQEISSLMDNLLQQEMNGRVDKKCIESFKDVQNYFIDNFVNPELEATLNSGDVSKISEVVKRIEQLQELGFEINGKNIFDDIAQKVNESIDKLHLDIQPLEISHENVGEKLKRQVQELISPIAQGVWNMKQAYSKGKEERKQLEDAFASAKRTPMSLTKFQQTAEERKALISGLGNLTPEEREAKYKTAAQEWEGRKASREAQTINNHARNSGELEK